MSSELPVRKTDLPANYWRANRFEFLLGVLAILAGISYFTSETVRETSSIAQAVTFPIGLIWSLTYALGGLLLCIGVARRFIALEAAGLWLVTAAVTVNIYGIFAVRGMAGFAFVPTYLLTLFVCVDRLHELGKMGNARNRH